jgi:4-amino-4-deoxy-L-arabinose transferase-like glycosyltransferase
VQTVRLDVALIFGMLSGLALLAKSSVRLFVALAVFAPIMEIKKQSKRVPSFLSNYIILYGVGVAIAITIYNVQRLSPFFQYVAEKNKTFIMTPQE